MCQSQHSAPDPADPLAPHGLAGRLAAPDAADPLAVHDLASRVEVPDPAALDAVADSFGPMGPTRPPRGPTGSRGGGSGCWNFRIVEPEDSEYPGRALVRRHILAMHPVGPGLYGSTRPALYPRRPGPVWLVVRSDGLPVAMRARDFGDLIQLRRDARASGARAWRMDIVPVMDDGGVGVGTDAAASIDAAAGPGVDDSAGGSGVAVGAGAGAAAGSDRAAAVGADATARTGTDAARSADAGSGALVQADPAPSRSAGDGRLSGGEARRKAAGRGRRRRHRANRDSGGADGGDAATAGTAVGADQDSVRFSWWLVMGHFVWVVAPRTWTRRQTRSMWGQAHEARDALAAATFPPNPFDLSSLRPNPLL